MKKILMTIAAAFVVTAMSAQVYVGGTLGFQNNKSNTSTTENTVTGFGINPEIGMSLDDKLGVGIQLGFNSNKNKTEYVGTAAGTPSVETTITTFELKPYLRYQLFQVSKFNVFVDGGVDFAIESQKDMKSGLDLGLFVTPGIAYNVTDNWSIVAKLNDMFNFGYSKSPVPDVAGAPDAPTSLNAGLSTGGFTLGALTFGVYYNF